MTTAPYNFPFGQPVNLLTQQDRTPKAVFVLGVYASAVHARWKNPKGQVVVSALAVASEPYIFWRGEGAAEIIAQIPVPAGVGKLVPASSQLNGPSGRSLDESYLTPLGLKREQAWLCDMVPHSCQNAGQAKAIQLQYAPLIKTHGLPVVTVPPVPKLLCDDTRRAEILAELQESKAKKIVLLGDEPISWFLQSFDNRYARLRNFGDTADTYGREHTVSIAGKDYQVLPLVHPRQAAKLGAHSSEWYGLHQAWLARMSREK